MRTLVAVACLAVSLPACADDKKSLNGFCAAMTASGKKGENLPEAYDKAVRGLEAAGMSGALKSHFTMMANVSSTSHPELLKEYAKDHGFAFSCDGWEFRRGKPKSPLIAKATGRISGLMVHAGALFWIDNGALTRAGLGGANAKVLHTAKPSGEDTLGNGDFVRLLAVGDTLVWIAGERVWRMKAEGGKPEELLKTGYAGELQVDGNALFVADDTRVVRVALDTGKSDVIVDGETRAAFVYAGGGFVWWQSMSSDYALRRKKLGDASAPETVQKLYQPNGFVRGPDGFWVVDRRLRAFPNAGAPAVPILTDGWKAGYPSSLVVNGPTGFGVFYGDELGWPNTGMLARVTLAETPAPVPIDFGFAGPHHLVQADGWLYWADKTGLYRTKVP